MRAPAPALLSVACLLLLLTSHPATADTITFSADTFIGCTDTTYDGHDIIVDGCTVTIDCEHDFASLQIINGGIVTHTTVQEQGMHLVISADLTVEAGSQLAADGCGHGPGSGPGAGAYGGDDPNRHGGGGGGYTPEPPKQYGSTRNDQGRNVSQWLLDMLVWNI